MIISSSVFEVLTSRNSCSSDSFASYSTSCLAAGSEWKVEDSGGAAFVFLFINRVMTKETLFDSAFVSTASNQQFAQL